MKKMIRICLLLLVFAFFVFGCAGVGKRDTTLKCPRCGAVFTIDEEMHWRSLTR
jgi:hypothetical protein